MRTMTAPDIDPFGCGIQLLDLVCTRRGYPGVQLAPQQQQRHLHKLQRICDNPRNDFQRHWTAAMHLLQSCLELPQEAGEALASA